MSVPIPTPIPESPDVNPSSTFPTDKAASSPGDSTFFLESQVGDPTVMSYSYTDDPWRLVVYDTLYFFRFAWALPWTILPLRPLDSGDLDEFAPTAANVFCLVMHAVLLVLQLAFLVALPFGFLLPVWMFALGVGAFLGLNHVLCMSLNGDGIEFHSDEKYATASPEHAHEQWICLNGVASGRHWTKSSLDRIALTFKRPVLGIHNRTSGVIFDIFECLIQRNFSYATGDVRACYRLVKEKLYDPKLTKVIIIMHSQGAIVGGLVLEWLLQELPQDLMGKLEVFSFGSAANRFNNPYRHESSQRLAKEDPQAAMATTLTETTETTEMAESPVTSTESAATNGELIDTLSSLDSKRQRRTNGFAGNRAPPLRSDSTSLSVRCAAHDRVLGHVEHYAHTTDFVAIWGILHFVRRQPASPTIPRFMGRVFVRSSERGGHQFTQHYLDGMFPLARDAHGNLTGAADENPFMESPVEDGLVGQEYDTIREAMDISYLGYVDPKTGLAPAAAVYGLDRPWKRARTGLKVKDLSRLWVYRNGMVPGDARVGRGVDVGMRDGPRRGPII
jgi:hypothetical protein